MLEDEVPDIERIKQGLQLEDPKSRVNALQLLLSSQPFHAFEMMAACLADPDPKVRYVAANVLGDLYDRRAIPCLINLARQERNEDVLSGVFGSFGCYLDPTVGEFLIEEAYREKWSRVPRQWIAKYLRNYDTDASVKTLTMLLQEDEDLLVQEDAVQSLYILNRPSLRPVWEEARHHVVTFISDIAEEALTQLDEAKPSMPGWGEPTAWHNENQKSQ